MYNPISVRDINTQDIEAIGVINAQSAPGVFLLSVDDLERLIRAATVAWVAVTDAASAGYLIGFASAARYDSEEFRWFKEQQQDFFYVDQLAVAAPFRGRGVGSLLYAELDRRAARQGWRSLNCEVNLHPPNPRSMAFHLRRGFTEVGRMTTTDGRRVALLRKVASL